MACEVRSEIAGSIWKLIAQPGATVADGEVVLVMESMKMEIEVEASCAGACRFVVQEGDAVSEGDLLAVIS